MKFYIDITLLSDADISLGFLWEKVYQQVHLALAENKVPEYGSAIAVSFPQYGDKPFPLGGKLRLFAQTEEQLQKLDIGRWLNRLTDYTHHTSIRAVPSNVDTFVCFKRKQFKSVSKIQSDIERRALYQSQKDNRPIDEVRAGLLAQQYDGKCGLPFVYMTSLSSEKDSDHSGRKKFRLFVEKEDVDQAQVGTFNCYGLSSRVPDKQATVPWF
ncbi:MAG: type I-F CRISPR-associated endoribonuclease Cas6/Csy4 [Mariprofundus sp.]|nr:type I-F CRISPR-associated endoribonuclease Cas6/Csy4 [Mariprofundus sp.]